MIYGIGRLEGGQTFGVVETRCTPCFYVAATARQQVVDSAWRLGIAVEQCELRTLKGESVVRLACPSLRVLRKLSDSLEDAKVPTHEADIPFHRLFRMQRGLCGPVVIRGESRPGTHVGRVFVNPDLASGDWIPELSVLSLDIETTPDQSTVTAVALVGVGPAERNVTEEVHVLGDAAPDDPPYLVCHADEKRLLSAFRSRVVAIDPDILTGWNVIDFDLRVLADRFAANRLPFRIGRSRDNAFHRDSETYGASRTVVHGRQVLDALHLVRRSLLRFDDFRLGTVAQAVLGRGKLLAEAGGEGMPEAIERARRDNRTLFADYCLEDARLVRDILDRQGLVRLTLNRSILTGLPLDRAWGSVAAFDFLYICELRKRGMVAPTASNPRTGEAGAPGGLVFAPEAGLSRNILVFDFKSLYPSIIRTFNIDPLSHAWAQDAAAADTLTAPNRAAFSRKPGILPGVLDVFFERRADAKARGDDLASFTYKIVMNSFYGVLGTRSCRFGSGRVAGAITSFGHYLLRWCRDLLESKGCAVLYGDTDSLFVDPKLPADVDFQHAQAEGIRLCEWVNESLATHVRDTYRVESRLELEFEKAYRRFLLPPGRGQSVKGRAKGYAGWRMDSGDGELEIVGMEAVRSDWTDMAHRFQRELLTRLFHDESGAQLERFIADWIADLKAGRLDHELVYRKRLRKSEDQYTRTTPPAVKVARMLGRKSGAIRYVVTTRGPAPADAPGAPLDYKHYVDKQIEPLVTSIAPFADIDVGAAVRGEWRLF